MEPQFEVAGVKVAPALGAGLVREVGPRGCAFPVFPSRWRYRIADVLLKWVCLRQRPAKGGAGAGQGVDQRLRLARDPGKRVLPNVRHSLKGYVRGLRKCTRQRKKEKREVPGQGDRRGISWPRVAPSFPFAFGDPLCPSLPLDLQFFTAFEVHWVLWTHRHGGDWLMQLHPQDLGPAMASLQGSSAQGIYQFRNSAVRSMTRKIVVLFLSLFKGSLTPFPSGG